MAVASEAGAAASAAFVRTERTGPKRTRDEAPPDEGLAGEEGGTYRRTKWATLAKSNYRVGHEAARTKGVSGARTLEYTGENVVRSLKHINRGLCNNTKRRTIATMRAAGRMIIRYATGNHKSFPKPKAYELFKDLVKALVSKREVRYKLAVEIRKHLKLPETLELPILAGPPATAPSAAAPAVTSDATATASAGVQQRRRERPRGSETLDLLGWESVDEGRRVCLDPAWARMVNDHKAAHIILSFHNGIDGLSKAFTKREIDDIGMRSGVRSPDPMQAEQSCTC
jgi:hypothetical protein